MNSLYLYIYREKLDVHIYHVNTQEGSPSNFSNKNCKLFIILPDNQCVHVIIKYYILRQMLAALGHDKVLNFESKRMKMAAMTQIFPQTL